MIARVLRHRRAAMVLTVLALLAVGFALQLAVYGDGGRDALSDLPRVFLHRRIGIDAPPYLDRPLEYPVGAGVLLWAAGIVAPSALGVLVVTAIAAAAVAVGITLTLERRMGARAWRWAAATPLLLYAFQNWDVFAIGAMLVGLLAFERGSDARAGAAFGIGAAIKVFPGVLIVPLAAVRLLRGQRREAARLVSAAALAFGLLNLPILLATPEGWWWPWAFQSGRPPTWGSTWSFVLPLIGLPAESLDGAHLANILSVGALAVGLAWLVFAARTRHLDALQVAGASIAILLLTTKVYSPTYDLWIVAFFVLLPLSRRLWIAFCAVDLAIYATVYGYFHGLETRSELYAVLPKLVLTRSVLLAVIVVAASRAAARRPAIPMVSEPDARVDRAA